MSAIGFGSKVAIDDGTSSAFVDVTGLVSITPNAEEVGKVESKRLDLVARTITSVQTLQKPGVLQYTYEMSPLEFSRHEGLRRNSTTNKSTPKNWKVTIADDTTPTVKTVPGFITKNAIQPVNAEGITEVQVEVEITGPAS
jgi:hypothetical protein